MVVGLAEDRRQYEDRGYTPLRMAVGHLSFRRRYGMPFATAPKPRIAATARACRAIVATRLIDPAREWDVFEGLQTQNFTTPLILDDDESLRVALGRIPGLDAGAIMAALDDPEVTAAYEADKAETRAGAGTAAELQGKTATTDGPVRFTAPSVTFACDGQRQVAGGFQPVEAYDVLIANLDPGLRRREAPDGPGPLLERFRRGLTTQEVAALMTRGNDAPDRQKAETMLLELVAAGAAVRVPAGDDAVWLTTAAGAELPEAQSLGVAAIG